MCFPRKLATLHELRFGICEEEDLDECTPSFPAGGQALTLLGSMLCTGGLLKEQCISVCTRLYHSSKCSLVENLKTRGAIESVATRLRQPSWDFGHLPLSKEKFTEHLGSTMRRVGAVIHP